MLEFRVRLALAASALALSPSLIWAQAQSPASASDQPVTVALHADRTGPVIARDIFGQFAEHLGEGIYGGIWVGKSSPIPNVRGIRSDVVAALRAIKVPVVRWPGGCYGDEYHWRNGIGPASKRATTINVNWGNALEPNSFGTDEFMDLLSQIGGAAAYVNVNVATGTPQEASDWLEYMTTNLPSTLGKERVANGHKEPWEVKYLGVGNESWGCGGSMSTENYVERLKLWTTFARNLHPKQASPMRYVRGPNAMQRIAVGPDADKTEYTEAVMQAWKTSAPWRWGFEGLSLHFYAMGLTPLASPATNFGEKDYAAFVKETLKMDATIARHSAIMDKYDPGKRVSLVVDEWGVWLKPLPTVNPRFLKQQNSLRDAILASLNLNIFARHADRVRMANIAQMVNVLQAMILTDKEKMLLTPTYWIYRMYVPFQDATVVPLEFDAGTYRFGDTVLPRIDALAARGKDGKVRVAMTNIDPNRSAEVSIDLHGLTATRAAGEVLTATAVDAVNTFEVPGTVSPRPLAGRMAGARLMVTLPAKSVAVLQLD